MSGVILSGTGPTATKVGIPVICAVCGKRKAPHGQTVPDGQISQWCTYLSDPTGYWQAPMPSDLWPGQVSVISSISPFGSQ